MSYILNWTNSDPVTGKPTIELLPGEADSTSTSVVLFGKGYPNYGEGQQENFIRLLENFAAPTAPLNPTVGQIWFDTNINQLKLFNKDEVWAPLSGVYVQDTEPDAGISYDGSLWFKPSTHNFYVYADSLNQWIQLDNVQIIRVAYNQEYNELVDIYNKIVGPMSIGASCATTYGWGQTSVLNHKNLPAEPVTNADWLFLMNKFKEIAPIVGIDVVKISDNGFIIEDHLATPYGIGTVIEDYETSCESIDALYLNRFNPVSSVMVATKLTNPDPIPGYAWANTQAFEFSFNWTSAEHLNRFFTTGGALRIVPSLVKQVENDATFIWEQLFYNLGGGINIKACLTVDDNESYEFVKNVSIFELDNAYKLLFNAIDKASYYTGSNPNWVWDPAIWKNAEISPEATVAFWQNNGAVNNPMVPDPNQNNWGEATILSPGETLLGGMAELQVYAKKTSATQISVRLALVDKQNQMINAIQSQVSKGLGR